MAKRKRAVKIRTFEAAGFVAGGLRGELNPGQCEAWLRGFGVRLRFLWSCVGWAENERERDVVRNAIYALAEAHDAAIHCVSRDDAAILSWGDSGEIPSMRWARDLALLLEIYGRPAGEGLAMRDEAGDYHALLRELLERAAA